MMFRILAEGGPYDGKEVYIDDCLIHDGIISLLRPQEHSVVAGGIHKPPRMERISVDYRIEQRVRFNSDQTYYVLACMSAS